MQTNLIRIGNSQGIRLPKAVIEQAGLVGELDLEVSGEAVVIRAARRTRADWSEAAAKCHEAGEDQLADWDAVTGDFEGDWS